MATKRPEDRISSSGPQSCPSTAVRPTDTRQLGAETQERLVYMQCCGQEAPNLTERNGHRKIMARNRQGPVFVPQGRTERVWTHPPAPQQTTTPTIPSCPVSAPYSFWSPGSVEMDEIMAAMVLTSLSCSPVVQSSPQSQNDSLPGSSSWGGDMECRGGDMECGGGDMECGGRDMECGGGDLECGGGELSDSGSSGYWSWDHGNVSPALSPSVAEMDSRPDEGLHMELGGELQTAARSKSSFRGTYRCLWPSCGKVLTSSVGMKRHVRVMHLGSGSEQSAREEDFYYTKISCEAPADPSLVSPLPPDPSPVRPLPPDPSPVSPLPPAPLPASSPHVPWASCGSPLSPDPDSGLQITSSGSGSSRPSSGPESAPYQHRPLSQSAPSSSWQIQTDHLYQAAPCCWTPPPLTVSNQHSHHNPQVVTGRCRSVSVGEQWLQQNSATNRLTTLRAASPSGSHCSFRKGRGEAKKCRKVYGVEHKEQWCTACRWKKACQRFTDQTSV